MDIPPALTYASEKFSDAVHSLAVGLGDVCSRLLIAHSEFCPIIAKELPPEVREDYEQICRELTKREEDFSGQGRVAATLKHMRNPTGAKIAEHIYDLHIKIESMIHPAECWG